MAITKVQRRNKIKKSIRGKVTGTASKPRLSVFRSNKEIYAQLVDDVAGVSICSVGSFNNKEVTGANKTECATLVGKKIAEIASGKGVTEVVFDRNGYLYHGRVKALAEGAREGGLKF
jgi:large subunit ribosomal protein L18